MIILESLIKKPVQSGISKGTMKPFTHKIRLKGWTTKELAKRWGLDIRTIQYTAAKPKQKDLDAIEGLPDKTKDKL